MSAIAPILQQTTGKICFNVDDVRPTKKQFTVQNAKSQIEKQLNKSIIAFSHDDTSDTL